MRGGVRAGGGICVVCFLISVTTDMPPTGGLLVTSIFERGVCPVACPGSLLRSVGTAQRRQLRTLWGNNATLGSNPLPCWSQIWGTLGPILFKSGPRTFADHCLNCRGPKTILQTICQPPTLSKLTWLVLGGDPAARSRTVEQFTAL